MLCHETHDSLEKIDMNSRRTDSRTAPVHVLAICLIGLCATSEGRAEGDPVGACCAPGVCIDSASVGEPVTEAFCIANIGESAVFQGEGTTCLDPEVPCGGRGACCHPTTGCADQIAGELSVYYMNEAYCLSTGGSYQGDGSTCDDATIDCPAGACCYPGQGCIDAGDLTTGTVTETLCEGFGGVFAGAETACDDAELDCTAIGLELTGACCPPGGVGGCVDYARAGIPVTEVACTAQGGSFLGIGTTCAESACGGACCGTEWGCVEGAVDPDGTFVIDGQVCSLLGGTYQGIGSTCAADCPPPIDGACCIPTGFTPQPGGELTLSFPGLPSFSLPPGDFPTSVCWSLATFDGSLGPVTPDMDDLCDLAGGLFLGEGTDCSAADVCDRSDITCPPDVTISQCDAPSPLTTGFATSALDDNTIGFNDSTPACGEPIIRTWTATGPFGSMTSCEQTISFRGSQTLQPGVSPSLTDIVECANASSCRISVDLLPGQTYSLTEMLPQLTGRIYLFGRGAQIERDAAAPRFRLFDVLPGGELLLDTVVLSGGSTSGNGGAVLNLGTLAVARSTVENNVADGLGGAVHDLGSTTVLDSIIQGNEAGDGGGLSTERGSLEVIRSTIRDNEGGLQKDLGVDMCGGITTVGGTLTVTNSTISGNSGKHAGGILTRDSSGFIATTTVTASTIDANEGSTAGGILSTSGALTITNSIVADSITGDDCVATTGLVIDDGHNLVDDGTCITAPTSLSGDPALSELADNGGLTPTHRPLPGSPVLEAGDCAGGTIDQDQRGLMRPSGAACDIGAVEVCTPITFVPNTNTAMLKQAIECANLTPGLDEITLAEDGTYQIFAADNYADGYNGLPVIRDSLIIHGNGARILRANNVEPFRIFRVILESGSDVVTIENLEIARGHVTGTTLESRGGGIRGNGRLRILGSTIHGNKASFGGGIEHRGNLVVQNSTITENEATSNTGGILFDGGQLDIAYSTISHNMVPANGFGGVVASGSSMLLRSTIIGQNVGSQCASFGVVSDLGYNIVSDGTCVLCDTPGNVCASPQLGQLLENGGPTPTRRPFDTSPALDAIPLFSNGCGDIWTIDQRGMPRPQNGSCDIGAFEQKDCSQKGPDFDADGDGVPYCFDCNDQDELVSEGAVETLCNGLDDDCNPETLDYEDRDGDGASICIDCADNDPNRSPFFQEIPCNGIDDDCDEFTLDVDDYDGDGIECGPDCDDNDPTVSPIIDNDGDFFHACQDCDDNDPNVNFAAAEVPCDGIDNDCNPETLDGPDMDGDGALNCPGQDCDDSDPNNFPGNAEMCDGFDNNCDGFLLPTELDIDGDGFLACLDDCDDGLANVFPGAAEVCDRRDNDCDGIIDNVPGLADCNGNGTSDACELVLRADFTADGAVSGVDYPGLFDCLSAPGQFPAPAATECESYCLRVFDSDADGDVDLKDVAGFVERFGTGIIAP